MLRRMILNKVGINRKIKLNYRILGWWYKFPSYIQIYVNWSKTVVRLWLNWHTMEIEMNKLIAQI
jgi:hypothetical protein